MRKTEHSLCHVNITKVRIESRLHDAADDSYRIPPALCYVPVDPVQDVETPGSVRQQP